jgi:hypothetical protein
MSAVDVPSHQGRYSGGEVVPSEETVPRTEVDDVKRFEGLQSELQNDLTCFRKELEKEWADDAAHLPQQDPFAKLPGAAGSPAALVNRFACSGDCVPIDSDDEGTIL